MFAFAVPSKCQEIVTEICSSTSYRIFERLDRVDTVTVTTTGKSVRLTDPAATNPLCISIAWKELMQKRKKRKEKANAPKRKERKGKEPMFRLRLAPEAEIVHKTAYQQFRSHVRPPAQGVCFACAFKTPRKAPKRLSNDLAKG